MSQHPKIKKWFKEFTVQPTNIQGLDENPIPVRINQYSAPMGDFIKEYIAEQSKPWWRKDKALLQKLDYIMNNIFLNWTEEI